jgi:hypothetical protein
MWQLTLSGQPAPNISDEDLAVFNRPRGGHAEQRSGWASLPGVETWGWKHYVKLLSHNRLLEDLAQEAGMRL